MDTSTPVPNPNFQHNKPLFQTAGNIESTAASSNQMEALVQRYYYHQELDKAHEQMKVMFTKYHLMGWILVKFRGSISVSESKNKNITFQREEHDKRIKSLRKELDWIAASQWMYTPIEKLIGQ